MSRHLSAANTVESKPCAGAGRAGRRSRVTTTRVNERTDTGFGLLKGVERSHPHKHRKAEPRKGAATAPRLRFVTSVFRHRQGGHLERRLGDGGFRVCAAAGEGEVALLTVRLDEAEGDLPRRPHLASIVCRHVQRAERAGGHGDRLPAHHMRPAAPAGPVEGGGVVSPLLPHHSDHLTGDLHGGLRSRLEDERARRLQSGGEAAGEDLHDPALAGVLSGEAHLEPVQRRVTGALRTDDGETDLSPGAAARAVERRPLTELRATENLADVRQIRRALSGEWESREGAKRERGAQFAEPVPGHPPRADGCEYSIIWFSLTDETHRPRDERQAPDAERRRPPADPGPRRARVGGRTRRVGFP